MPRKGYAYCNRCAETTWYSKIDLETGLCQCGGKFSKFHIDAARAERDGATTPPWRKAGAAAATSSGNGGGPEAPNQAPVVRRTRWGGSRQRRGGASGAKPENHQGGQAESAAQLVKKLQALHPDLYKDLPVPVSDQGAGGANLAGEKVDPNAPPNYLKQRKKAAGVYNAAFQAYQSSIRTVWRAQADIDDLEKKVAEARVFLQDAVEKQERAKDEATKASVEFERSVKQELDFAAVKPEKPANAPATQNPSSEQDPMEEDESLDGLSGSNSSPPSTQRRRPREDDDQDEEEHKKDEEEINLHKAKVAAALRDAGALEPAQVEELQAEIARQTDELLKSLVGRRSPKSARTPASGSAESSRSALSGSEGLVPPPPVLAPAAAPTGRTPEEIAAETAAALHFYEFETARAQERQRQIEAAAALSAQAALTAVEPEEADGGRGQRV